jgi:hypothetical protein
MYDPLREALATLANTRHGLKWQLRLIPSAFLITMAGIGLACVSMGGGRPFVVFTLIGVAAAVLTYVALTRIVLSIDRDRVTRRGLFSTVNIPWKDVAEYRYSEDQPVHGGATHGGMVGFAANNLVTGAYADSGGSECTLTIVATDGRRVRMSNHFAGAMPVIGFLLDCFSAARCARDGERLARGEHIVFGPLALDAAGISYGKKHVRYDAVKGCGLVSGTVFVAAKGDRLRSAIVVAAERVPDVLAFLSFVRERSPNLPDRNAPQTQ